MDPRQRTPQPMRLHDPDPRAEVDAEFAFHLEERIEELVARGLSPEAARAEALARFGDIERARATCSTIGERRGLRARWRSRVESVGQDVAYALRTFRRAPGFVAAAVLTAALGIGANTAVFSIVNALLLRPLPVERPHEIARVYTTETDGTSDALGNSSYQDYLDLRRRPAFAALAVYTPQPLALRRGTAVTRIETRLVSDNFFATLGVRPALGRLLGAGDGVDAGAPPPVVLDHRFWTSAFAADPSVVGTTVWLNDRSAVIVGVAAAEFSGIDLSAADAYVPIAAQRALVPAFDLLSDRGDRLLKVVGRLAPGVEPARAEQELNVVMRALADAYPATNRARGVAVRSARSLLVADEPNANFAPITVLLFAATGVVLVIAAVNVAGLMLARLIARRREIAVRLSLGAGRGRIVRQLVTEGVVLALAAEGLALLAASALGLLARAVGAPPNIHFEPDARVFLFASAVTLAAGAAFGLAPALHGTAAGVAGALRDGDSSARPGRARAQRALVALQVALSVLLLVVGALLVQGLREQQRVRPGFETRRVIAAEFEGSAGYQTPAQERAFAAEVLPGVRALPGVVAAAMVTNPPLTGDGMRTYVGIPGYRPAPGEDMEIPFVRAGSDYHRALGIPLAAGEEISAGATDTLPRVVVNESMARRYWPGRSPVGTTVRVGGAGGPLVPVIGVAADARLQSLALPPGPRFVLQRADGGGSSVLVRTTADAASAVPAVRDALMDYSGPFALRRLRTMHDILGASLTAARALATTVAVLGALALTLAVLGLYSVVSYLAAQRTREFGIRMALGARPRDVLRLVLASGVRLTLLGGTAGLALGLAAAALARGLVQSTSPLGVATIAAVTALVAAATLAACLVPAARATRTSPAVTLRAE